MANSSAHGALLIEGGDVVLPDRVVESGVVLVSGGKIISAGPAENLPDPLPSHCRKIDVAGALVYPALWEPHIHGCGGFSTENGTRDSLVGIAKHLASRGVGAFVPTIVADEGSLASLAEALESPDCQQELAGRVPGIHVEGPFVAPSRRGGIPERLVEPISLDRLEHLKDHARGRIRVMTFAPELEGANALADRLSAMDILPSLGHSNARFEDLGRYDQVSPLCVTHLFNGMSGVSHKEPGLAQWALLNREAFTELICDGMHVHDAGVRLALRARPWERIVLSSDAVALAGVPEESLSAGRFSLYGIPVAARGTGVYYAASGVLVGSRMLVNDAVRHLVSEFEVPVASAVAMATRNPARLFGFARKGALLPGCDADVAVFRRDFSRCAFLAWEGTPLFEEGGAL